MYNSKDNSINKPLLKLDSENNDSTELIEEPFLKQNPINYISTIDHRAIIRTHHILNYIKEHPNSTPYQISKDLDINYTNVSKTIKDLEYCRLVYVRVEIGDNNRTHKCVYIPEEEMK